METTTYRIETLNAHGQWDAEMVGTDNEFATAEEAEAMIPELRKMGEDWANAEYRVVPNAG